LWLDEPTLLEMLQTMVPGRPIGRLSQALVERDGATLPCPSCNKSMRAVTFCGLPIDRCDAHGIWFDARELELALRRFARDADGQLDIDIPATSFEDEASPGWTLHLAVWFTDGVRTTPSLTQKRIVIGTAPGATVRLRDDPGVASLHAIVEVFYGGDVVITALDTQRGLRVNGVPFARAPLRRGDRVTLGSSMIDVLDVTPVI
jgi:hypothetical protein